MQYIVSVHTEYSQFCLSNLPAAHVPNSLQPVTVIFFAHTQTNLFQILLNQPHLRLYLPFSDIFGTKRKSVWFQINWCMVNTILFQFDLIRFGKDFSVCTARNSNFVRRKVIGVFHQTLEINIAITLMLAH